MAERLKAHASKACDSVRGPWVRIPVSPPCFLGLSQFYMAKSGDSNLKKDFKEKTIVFSLSAH